MSDPTRCRGIDPNGEQCICMRADETYMDNKRTLCINCGHIASAHPQVKPSVSSFVRGFRDAAKIDSISAKASQEEAVAETSAGLRNTKKRKPDSNVDLPPKKANKGKGKAPKSEGEQVKYGKAVMLTCGTIDGSLCSSKAPSHQEMQEMRRAKLVVLSTPSQPLYIDTSWTNEQANDEIERLFPEATRFLRRKYPAEDQLWLGATSHKHVVTLAGDLLPTGVELSDYCKVLGRPTADRILYIASKYKIAKRHWHWPEPESEDLGSDIDTIPSEDIVVTPPKPRPAYKGKGKAKEVKVEPEPETGLRPIEEAGEETEPDMRKAAKMRTRLDTGVIKRTTLFIQGSSDGPDPEDENIINVSDEEFPALLSFKNKSPSPARGVSPNQDPPSFFDDFTYSISPPPVDSSSTAGSSIPNDFITATFPSWTPAPAPLTTIGAEPPNLTVPPANVVASNNASHRFKKMGKGRGN